MDLLTRRADLGNIGSTVNSLVYASCTFFFGALEAATIPSLARPLGGDYRFSPMWMRIFSITGRSSMDVLNFSSRLLLPRPRLDGTPETCLSPAAADGRLKASLLSG